MNLFNKKAPCPICGGKISWLFQSKIENEIICSKCSNKIDMDIVKANQLTMSEFKEYLQFYDENQRLKNQFEISQRIDFGNLDSKIIFDYQKKLFSLSKKLDKTVFEGNQLRAFVIKEDNVPIFEGSPRSIKRYGSAIPERIKAFEPIIEEFKLTRLMPYENNGSKENSSSLSYFDVPGPFKSFHVELYLDHPYWTVVKCDMDGPRFDRNLPDINDYLRTYLRNVAELEKLVDAFKLIAFPEAPDRTVDYNSLKEQEPSTVYVPITDSIEEFRRF